MARVAPIQQTIQRKRLLDHDSDDERGPDGQRFNQQDEVMFRLDPENRAAHQVDFDEAIRLATDNKINTNNTWGIALIDYFHDMNLLRSYDDSTSINFQKAGATLDGCMKVLSHRIDSVAVDTGKLLSGLGKAKKDSAIDQGAEGELGDEDDVEADNDDEYTQKRKRRVTLRGPRENLKESFDFFRLKSYEKELAIDPLFKKTLSDFDEGGAKSLLLNSLSLNRFGRIVFDDSMASNSKSADSYVNPDLTKEEEEMEIQKRLKDIEDKQFDETLNRRITMHKNPTDVDCELMVSSGLRNLQEIVTDFQDSAAKEFVDNMLQLDENNVFENNIGSNDDNDNDNIHDNGDPDSLELFGENGADALDNRMDIDQDEEDDEENDEENIELEKNVLGYFDNESANAWRGPQHWKVSIFRKTYVKKVETDDPATVESKKEKRQQNGEPIDIKDEELLLLGNKISTKKAKSESMKINFLSDENEPSDLYFEQINSEDDLFQIKKNQRLVIPESRRIAEEPTSLPDDFHWSSDKLIKSFLRPKLNLRIFQKRKFKQNKGQKLVANEEFWAENYSKIANGVDYNDFGGDDSFNDSINNSVSASISNRLSIDDDDDDDDDGYGDIDFNSQLPSASSQSQSRYQMKKENQLKYAKVAKKVDVRLLKDRLWEATTVTANNNKEGTHSDEDKVIDVSLKRVVNNVGNKYEDKQRKDLSTSFFFICMLHLANEHDLTIESTRDFTDLKITGVVSAANGVDTDLR